MLYTYTIVLLALLFSACALCCAGYAISRSRRYLVQSALIGAYLLELVILFGEEWSIQNVAEQIGAGYYGITMPLAHIALGGVMALAEWLTCCIVTGNTGRATPYAAGALEVAAAIAVSFFMPFGPFRQFTFYTVRQISLMICLAYGLCSYIASKEASRAIMVRYKRTFWILAILVIATVIEDAWCILLLPIPNESTSPIMLLFSYRNLAENATMLVLASLFSSQALHLISAHFDKPLGYRDEQQGTPATDDQIALMMTSFATRHHLTGRESEVLGLLLEGKGNKSIAQELFVVEGTVKTHTHNIMKKVGVRTRDELRQTFWSS